MISETRGLLTSGTLKAAKIDSNLVIPENFEDKLSAKIQKGTSLLESDVMFGDEIPYAVAPGGGIPNLASVPTSSSGGNMGGSAEAEKMQKKLVLLVREVQTLKQENSVLKDKLDKIKKIA